MSFHIYRLNELYSNADGSIQFIELVVGNVNGESFWQGQTISATQGSTTHTYTFPNDLGSAATANRSVLVATQGFANLGLVAPDFIVPAQFLFTNGGTVNFAGVSSVTYASLPTDGSRSLNSNNTTGINSPTNFLGLVGTVTNTNNAPTGSVIISGMTTQGQTVTASNTLGDADGLGTISYQWKAGGSNISGAKGSTFVLTEAQVGTAITVTASYTDGRGTAESVTSVATGAVTNVNDAPTGAVTVAGTTAQDQTLTAANTLADADGLGNISYQWKAGGSAISGATGSTFVLTEAQVGKAITVTASYTDGHGTAESVTSGATGTVTQAQTLTPAFGLKYIASYPDLIAAFGTNAAAGIAHYVQNGLHEGRTATFDGLKYIASYPDLIAAFGINAEAGIAHYIQSGLHEGRTASFDALKYTASYGDLINAFGTNTTAAETHYIGNGYAEGRIATFDALKYTASYGDLINAFGTNTTAAEAHFINNGFAEGRTATFDGQSYVAANLDLLAAFGLDAAAGARHYIQDGYREGRQASLSSMQHGGAGDDILIGTTGKDLLDGGAGHDTFSGGAGQDIFVLRAGDGGATLQLADVITDFQDGTDRLGLAGSLAYASLNIQQGNGTHAADTIVSTSSGEYLAILNNLLATNLNSQDFVHL
ncbi:MAG: hypothetical protein HY848_09780 [Betaproteobacteria bacterium]|nr:hypothetical protein [Betaproteobacteria bacterium]